MATNVIDSLFSELLSDDTLKNIVEATGVSKEGASEILSTAIPTLISAMAGNAASKEGAVSLSNALAQHASKTKVNVPNAVKTADLVDGQKIIGHILGGDMDDTVDKMSTSTSINKEKVKKILSMVAPIILTFIARGKKTNKKGDTASDMTSLLSSFVTSALADSNKSSSNAALITGLVSSLLGSRNSSQGSDASALIGSILKTVLK